MIREFYSECDEIRTEHLCMRYTYGQEWLVEYNALPNYKVGQEMYASGLTDSRLVDAQSKSNSGNDNLCPVCHPTLMNSPFANGGHANTKQY